MRRAVVDMKGQIDWRTQKSLRELTYAVTGKGTTRLNQLAQFLFPWHQAKTAHPVETAFSTCLQKAKYEEAELLHCPGQKPNPAADRSRPPRHFGECRPS
jgi:hypothetical protein